LTRLNVCTRDAVTAASHQAGIGARIVCICVSIVACLDPSLQESVTAGSVRTVIQARVRLQLVSIVTNFDASLGYSVTTLRHRATI
jgi:hypothetical protein